MSFGKIENTDNLSEKLNDPSYSEYSIHDNYPGNFQNIIQRKRSEFSMKFLKNHFEILEFPPPIFLPIINTVKPPYNDFLRDREKKSYIERESIYGKFIFKKKILDTMVFAINIFWIVFFSLILMILIISLISKPHLMISSSNSVLNCIFSKKYLRHYFLF